MMRVAALALGLCVLVSSAAWAQTVPMQVPVKVGVKLRTGLRYWFRWALFDGEDPAASTELWAEEMDLAGPRKLLRSRQLAHDLGSIASPDGPLDPADFTQQLWLQVSRRRAGAWVPCSPRVRLAAAAYALHSASGAAPGPGSVTSATIADGAVTTAKLDAGAVTGGKIADGAVSLAKLAADCAEGELLVMGAAGWACSAPRCLPGDFVSCYPGPAGTRDVGPCRAGERLCGAGGTFGACDAVVPQPEACDGEDNDCDGLVDEIAACLPGPDYSAQIQAARDTPDGTGLALPLDQVVVTALKPLDALDPAGFFVQAEQAGPALFVAVDPAGLSPAPAPGDVVAFTVTEMGTTASQRRALAIGGYGRIATGVALAAIVQDVSAATDLVSALDAYESELLGLAGTVGTPFAAAGTGYVAARLDTAGVSGATGLQLRLPQPLQESLGLDAGCGVTLPRAPMWRLNATAEPAAWTAGEISGSCPAPAVVAAAPTDATTVSVAFTRLIAPGSVDPAGSQFTFTGGLAASGATVFERTVLVTTDAQTPSAPYTVTVAATVTDTIGAAVDPAADSAPFAGHDATAPHLVINEVDYDNPGADLAEFIEVHNPTAGPIDLAGHALVLVNGNGSVEFDRIPLSGTIPAGGYAVVGPGDLGVQNGAPDGVALVGPANTVLDALSYEGSIVAAQIGGIAGTVSLVEGTPATAADDGAPGSLQRCPDGTDTDDAAADWAYADTLTMGAANSCP